MIRLRLAKGETLSFPEADAVAEDDYAVLVLRQVKPDAYRVVATVKRELANGWEKT